MTYQIEIVPGPPLHVFRSLNGVIKGKVPKISGLLTNKTVRAITIMTEGTSVYSIHSAFNYIERRHKVSSTYVLKLPPNHPFQELEVDQFYEFNANGTARSLSTGGGTA